MAKADSTHDDEALRPLYNQLEEMFGLPTNFMFDMFGPNQADYLMVIKGCALVETVLNEAIQDLAPLEWRGWLVDRSLSEKRRLAVLAGLVRPRDDRALGALVRIRNRLVHDVSGFAFTFAEHLADADARNEWAMNASLIYVDARSDATSASDEHKALAVDDPWQTAGIIAVYYTLALVTSSKTSRGKAWRAEREHGKTGGIIKGRTPDGASD
jgi:hypothetical protein